MTKSEIKKIVFTGTREEVKAIPIDQVKQMSASVQRTYYAKVNG